MNSPSGIPAPPRRVSVCADDFGANEAASLATLALARAGAISSASCMVHAPCVERYARELCALAPAVSAGLHLDLTEFAPLPIRASLRRWLARGFLMGNIDRVQVMAEIRRQLDCFQVLFGRAPAFVDGHCHVHQIPGIREPLLEELQRRYGRSVAVRSTRTRGAHGLKGRFIEDLGGRSLHALIERAALPANADFAGAYDLVSMSAFGRSMRSWLHGIATGGLIMCHPELPRHEDAPANAREAEYCFLASPDWARLRARLNVQLQPFAAG